MPQRPDNNRSAKGPQWAASKAISGRFYKKNINLGRDCGKTAILMNSK
jgi:hypothetical protein